MKTLVINLVLLVIFFLPELLFGKGDNELNNGWTKINHNAFIENKGQWPEEVKFLVSLGGMNAWITDSGVVYDYYQIKKIDSSVTNPNKNSSQILISSTSGVNYSGHVLKMSLVGANKGVQTLKSIKQNEYYNYFIGNDQSKWTSEVSLFSQVEQKDVYNGISLRYYFDNGNLRYDYVIKPNSDIGQILIKIDGSENVEVNSQGELVLMTSLGYVKHGGLFSYQYENGKKVEVACGFEKGNDGTIRIKTENYDTNKELIIDPMVYSTLIGSSNNEYCYSITIGADGCAYVVGNCLAGYPTTAGAYHYTSMGGWDAFISKINVSGSALVYSTFIGGGANEDGNAIKVDSDGSVIITGDTQSTDFPVTTGSYQTVYGGNMDGFITKLNSAGTSLIFSTYLGGGGTDVLNGISCDTNSNIYVTGRSTGDFPTRTGDFQSSYMGSEDAIVVKINPYGNTLIYSTYIGGSGFDRGYGIDVAADCSAYVTGMTTSGDFPIIAGAFQSSLKLSNDAFVVKLNPAGNALVYSTYIGGSSVDYAYGIAVDLSGCAYVIGQTLSGNFPVATGSFQTILSGVSDAFVTKISPSGGSIIYSTFLGGSENDIGAAITLNNNGCACVTGHTVSSNFPISSGAEQSSLAGADDIFVSKLSQDGRSLVYSTFLGGVGSDIANAISEDLNGNVYIAGNSSSTNYPVSLGAYQTAQMGGSDIFISKLSLPELSIIAPMGGENWQVGSSHNITWKSANVANIKIEYTIDSGKNWITIVQSTSASSGSYSWTIPNTPSAKCYVKISDVSNSVLLDSCHYYFRINNDANYGQPCSGMPTVIYAGKTYNTVKIGNQCWLKENLDVGSMIDSTNNQTNNGLIEKYCYNNDTINCSIYGGLYQWAEAVQYKNGATNTTSPSPLITGNLQGICPSGWHLPTNEELQTLGAVVNSSGNGMKAIGQGSGSGTGTNTSGFSALLTGYRSENYSFFYLGISTYFWSSEEYNAMLGHSMALTPDSNIYFNVKGDFKVNGFSVRCVMNALSAPTLQSPSSGSTDILLSPTMTWNASSGALTYRIQVSTDTGFANLIYNDSTLASTSKQITGLAKSTKYYWRVNAKSNFETSVWSNIWSFTTVKDTTQLNFWQVMGLPNIGSADNVTKVVVAPNGYIFAGTASHGMFRSKDSGKTWEQIISGFNVNHYVWDIKVSSAGKIYVGTQQGYLYVSSDYGNNWLSKPVMQSTFFIAVQTLVILPNGTLFAGASNGACLKSTDDGATWSSVNICSNNRISSLLLYPNDDLYAGTQYEGAFKSTDGGATWITLNTGLGSSDAVVSLSMNKQGWIYIGTNLKGTYVSSDKGANWSKVSGGLPDNDIESMAFTSNGFAFAGTWGAGVYCSTDNGSQWSPKNSGITSNAIYSLAIDSVGFIYAGASDGLYQSINSITTLSLTTPTGGENWYVGSAHNITWTSSNVSNVKLEYTKDGGTTWGTIIASMAASTGSYSWTIPNSVSTNCKVRVSDASNSSLNSVSVSSFTISAAPLISLTSPVGGENWNSGTTQDIRWTSRNVAKVKIEYSKDGGANWNVVVQSMVSSGSFSWTVPNTPSLNCKIRISDTSNASLNSVTAGVFSIVAVPAITVTSPVGGENWTAGTLHNISWSSTSVSKIKLEYSTDSGTDWSTITASVAANVGVYSWNVPNTPSTTCKVRISDTSNASVNSVSAAVFSITAVPAISLTAPVGGERWQVASSHNITWTSTNVSKVKLEYSTDSGASWTTIAASTVASTGIYSWTIPNTPSSSCKVRISDTSNASLNSLSSSVFSIVAAPALTLTSPVGGESWQVGTAHNITWSSASVSKIKLEYSTDSGTGWATIVASTVASSGSYSWTIPNSVSTTCRVRISDTSNTSLNSVSSGVFAITAAPQPTISISAPAGGEYWLAGSTQSIKWSSSLVTNVQIEYSTNEGTDWTLVVASTTAASGSYSWTIPNTLSSRCKIRVSDASNINVYAINSGLFTIYKPAITLISPIGGEQWLAGSQQKILWASSYVNAVKIELSTDAGSNWSTVVSATDALAGNYSWTLPGLSSSQCLIKISDTASTTTNTQSSSTFTIYIPTVTLTSPVGGESWTANTEHLIKWSSSYITNIKIEYSYDNAANWTVIESSYPAGSGVYSWVVAQFPSQQCRVRISDAGNSATNSFSPVNFTILPIPSITVTSPNGGERWLSSETHQITWNCNVSDSVNVLYSIDGAANWQTIAENISASNGSYSWLIPETFSDNCFVKVTAAKFGITDQSDAKFSIAPSAVLSLSQNTLSFDTVFVDSIKVLHVSIQNTGTGTLRIDSVKSTAPFTMQLSANFIDAGGSQDLQVSFVPKYQAAYNATLHIYNNGVKHDAGLIVSGQGWLTPYIKFLAANKSDWEVGTQRTIQWDQRNVLAKKLEYSIDGGSNWKDIAVVDASANEYTWTIPNDTSKNALVRIKSTSSYPVQSVSDAFTIFGYPTQLPVAYQYTFTSTESITNYRMFSIPGNNNLPAKDLFSGEPLYDWKLVWDNGDTAKYQVKYDGSALFNFIPGRGYWALSKNPINLSKSVNPVTFDSLNCYAINLHGGWNIISNPFDKEIPWSRVQTINGLASNDALYGWSGAWSQAASLVPYQGYYYYNTNALSTLKIPYNPYPQLNKAGKVRNVAGAINLTLGNGGYELSKIVINFDSLSFLGYDAGDYFAPPSDFAEQAMWIKNEHLVMPYKSLRVDSRSGLQDGQSYDLMIKNIQKSNAELSLTVDSKKISDDTKIILLETRFYKPIDLKQKKNVTIPHLDEATNYKLLVGKESFVNSELKNLLPQTVILNQNYPNPFNPATTISFVLPKQSKVQLVVYDILGKEVAKLVDGELETGYHEVTFNAAKFASGVYLCRLQSENTTLVKKMMIVK